MTQVDNNITTHAWLYDGRNGFEVGTAYELIDNTDYNGQFIIDFLVQDVANMEANAEIQQGVAMACLDDELKPTLHQLLDQCGLTSTKESLAKSHTEAMVDTLARYFSECEDEGQSVDVDDRIVNLIHFLCANPSLTSEDDNLYFCFQ